MSDTYKGGRDTQLVRKDIKQDKKPVDKPIQPAPKAPTDSKKG